MQSSSDFDSVLAQLTSAAVLVDPDFRVVAANDAYLQAVGRTGAGVVGRSLFEVLLVAADRANAALVRASLDQVLTSRTAHAVELAPDGGDDAAVAGDQRHWNVLHAPILNDRGELALILQHAVDVARLRLPTAASGTVAPSVQSLLARQASGPAAGADAVGTLLDAEAEHLRRLFEQAPGFVCSLRGPQHVFELANQAYYQLVGHREIIGRPVREALPELEGQGLYELLDRVYSHREPFIGRAMPILLQRIPNGPLDEVFVDFVYQPIIAADGSVSGIFVQGHEVTETHKLNQQIRYQASHDALTGLINRQEFERRLSAAVAEAATAGEQHVLLWIDLDQFKVVNDTCGHAAGDEMLRQVGRILRQQLRASDTLARLGGDEFAVLLKGCPANPAARLAEAMLAALAGSEFVWEQRRFVMSASIGVVMFDGRGEAVREILSAADSACYLAKEKGRGRIQFYRQDDVELSARLKEMDWVGRLRDAVHSERLVLYAQKIRPVDDASEEGDHREILLRLREVDGTLVPPMAFLPAAERYNLMPMIDRYVVRAAVRHLVAMPSSRRERTWYSINLSGRTLDDDTFLHYVKLQVAEHDVPPSQICFEITETAAISQLVQAGRLIRELKALGFRFALDDFGSGMSSFGYLKHLPVDYLKIDGVFVKDIAVDPVDRAIVEAIAKVARALGLQTIAEYVENDAILEQLRSLGVDFAQGYGVHRPEPLTDA